MNLVRAITDRIFGYNIFVSDSRKDGMPYAQELDPTSIGTRNILASNLRVEYRRNGET